MRGQHSHRVEAVPMTPQLFFRSGLTTRNGMRINGASQLITVTYET